MDNVFFISYGTTVECVLIALALAAGLTVAAKKILYVTQKLGYDNKGLFRWSVKKYNLIWSRLTLLMLCSSLSACVLALCFAFCDSWAAVVSLAGFVLFFALYGVSDMRSGMPVEHDSCPRLTRSFVTCFVVFAVLSYIVVTLLNFAANVYENDMFTMMRYVPLGIMPILLIPMTALSNLIIKAYESPKDKRAVKRARANLDDMTDVKIIYVWGDYGRHTQQSILGCVLSPAYDVHLSPECCTVAQLAEFIDGIKSNDVVADEIDDAVADRADRVGADGTDDAVADRVERVGTDGVNDIDADEKVCEKTVCDDGYAGSDRVAGAKNPVYEPVRSETDTDARADLILVNCGALSTKKLRQMLDFCRPDISVFLDMNRVADQSGVEGLGLRATKEKAFFGACCAEYAGGIDCEATICDGFSDVVATEKSVNFNLLTHDSEMDVSAPLLGRKNVEYLTTAIYVAESLNVSKNDIMGAIAAVKPLPSCLELKKGDKYTVLDCGKCSSLTGVDIAMDALSLVPGRHVCVTRGILDCGVLDADVNASLGEKLATCGKCFDSSRRVLGVTAADGIVSDENVPDGSVASSDTGSDAAARICDKVIFIGDTQIRGAYAAFMKSGRTDGDAEVFSSTEKVCENFSSLFEDGDVVLLLNEFPDLRSLLLENSVFFPA